MTSLSHSIKGNKSIGKYNIPAGMGIQPSVNNHTIPTNPIRYRIDLLPDSYPTIRNDNAIPQCHPTTDRPPRPLSPAVLRPPPPALYTLYTLHSSLPLARSSPPIIPSPLLSATSHNFPSTSHSRAKCKVPACPPPTRRPDPTRSDDRTHLFYIPCRPCPHAVMASDTGHTSSFPPQAVPDALSVRASPITDPCPFCGGAARAGCRDVHGADRSLDEWSIDISFWYVTCDVCGASVFSPTGAEDARTRWSRRAPAPVAVLPVPPEDAPAPVADAPRPISIPSDGTLLPILDSDSALRYL